jgi:hypothetical protein
VVAFRLGQQGDPDDESESAAEVVERELPSQGAGAVALPARDFVNQPGDLRLWKWWRPRRVLLGVVLDKLGYGRTVPMSGRPPAGS